MTQSLNISHEQVRSAMEAQEKQARAEVEAQKIEANKPVNRRQGWRAVKGPQKDNTSGFHATGHRILLLPDVVEEKSAGGIVLVSKTQKAEQDHAVIATVIEIGYDAWTDKSTDYCNVGDRVLIGQYTGKFHESPVDGKLYRFVQDLDIISPIDK